MNLSEAIIKKITCENTYKNSFMKAFIKKQVLRHMIGIKHVQLTIKSSNDVVVYGQSDADLRTTITIEDCHYQQALKSLDFIKKHIFPGSIIPSVGATLSASVNTTLKLVNLEDFAMSYAYTLRDWQHKFEDNIEAIEQAGYLQDFQRMWRFYFSYCEGGFIERAISDVHLLLAKPDNKRDALLAIQ